MISCISFLNHKGDVIIGRSYRDNVRCAGLWLAGHCSAHNLLVCAAPGWRTSSRIRSSCPRASACRSSERLGWRGHPGASSGAVGQAAGECLVCVHPAPEDVLGGHHPIQLQRVPGAQVPHKHRGGAAAVLHPTQSGRRCSSRSLGRWTRIRSGTTSWSSTSCSTVTSLSSTS